LAAREGQVKCLELLYIRGHRKNALSASSAFKGFTDCVKLLFGGTGKHAALAVHEFDLTGGADLPPRLV
jgi:hypothetical protein